MFNRMRRETDALPGISDSRFWVSRMTFSGNNTPQITVRLYQPKWVVWRKKIGEATIPTVPLNNPDLSQNFTHIPSINQSETCKAVKHVATALLHKHESTGI